jgi:hypothetical protein
MKLISGWLSPLNNARLRFFREPLPTRERITIQIDLTPNTIESIHLLEVLKIALVEEWINYANIIVNDELLPIGWNTLTFLDDLTARLTKSLGEINGE